MFIRMYMNILIYTQERRECTMQNKIFIYKSINKQGNNHRQFLHSTHDVCVQKKKREETAVRKSSEILFFLLK